MRIDERRRGPRSDTSRWEAANRNTGEFDDLEPLAREPTETLVSSLLRGSPVLRANKSGLVRDASLVRPKRAATSAGQAGAQPQVAPTTTNEAMPCAKPTSASNGWPGTR